MTESVKPLAMRTDDEGELTVAVTEDSSGQIIVDFGKKIHWLAMDKKTAADFAMSILRRSVDSYISMKLPDPPAARK